MNIIETNVEFTSLSKRIATNKGIFHNSGVTVLQSVEIIHNYHKNTNGWAGIGYHFYIKKDGSIYRGRPIDTIGAHAYGANADSIGICFEGNFNEEEMTDKQVEAGKWIVNYLRNLYPDISFCGHKDVCNTSCPGKNFKFDEIVNAKVEVEVQVQVQETKSIVDLANEVIAGKYGVGEARKQALGSLYNEVQAKVNEILLGKKVTTNKKSNEEIADEVIAGKWGNNPSRKEKLTNAGYDANAIQKIVNKKLK